MNRRSIVLTGLSALCACAGTSQTRNAMRYSGTWDFHFETSSFITDDGRGPWWLSADGEGEIWRRLTAPLEEGGSPWGRVAIVIEGELSEPGRYGHLGAYERELRVTRVISARLIERHPGGS